LLWETFGFDLNSQLTGPRTDDDFYTKPSYSGFKFVSALLAPSAGLLFAAVFFRFQPGALALLSRLSRSCLLAALRREPLSSNKTSVVVPAHQSSSLSPSPLHGAAEAVAEAAKAGADAAEVRVMGIEEMSSLDDDALIQACIDAQTQSSSQGKGKGSKRNTVVPAPTARKASTHSQAKLWKMILVEQVMLVTREKGSAELMFAAVHAGEADKLREALSLPGINTDEVDDSGSTAVHVAACSGALDCLALLAEHGADLDRAGPEGLTPAALALQRGHLPCLQLLYSRGAACVQGVTLLHLYAALGKTEELQGALSKDASGVHVCDGRGKGLAHWACEHGQAACLRILVSRAADVNLKDKQRTAPLHVCCTKGEVACAKVLFKAGADYNLADGDGDTPAFRALMARQWECFTFLEENGAAIVDVNKCDDAGKSVCYHAATAGEEQPR
jgi:ankyrin repeat protein